MSELIIKNIHPLNAEYLLSTEPHRFYLDEGGNILELTVRRFSHLVVEKLYEHGGVIVAGYYDTATEGRMNFCDRFILRRDGYILPMDMNQTSMQDEGLDIDMLYMLLNPVNMNGWISEKRGECYSELREQGKVLNISQIFQRTKIQYLQFLQGNS